MVTEQSRTSARTPARRNKRVIAAVVGSLSAGVLVAGCGPMLTANAGAGTGTSDATIAISPAPGGAPAKVNDPVVITSNKGRLVDVVVTGSGGAVAGTMSDDGKKWSTLPGAELAFDSTYQVQATAVDSDGRTTQTKNAVKTMTPAATFGVTKASVEDGQTYGVGMPIAVEFDTQVANRAEVEKLLHVKSSKPVVGAWSWNEGGDTVTFRPKGYWPANTDVAFKADLYGVQANPETWGNADTSINFKVGSSVIMDVDDNTKEMVVKKDGQVIQTIPITMGKPGFETRSGVKVISAKEGTVIMDAATTGTSTSSSEYYRLEVDYAMRLTDSGEFIHAAPWSTWAQGSTNASHGCIGMSTGDASWLWDQITPGDVVVVSNTGRETDLGNGITVWNEPWPQWLKGSATGAQQVGPTAEAPVQKA